jgi:peptide/nickel transport system substrate-binding protein
VPPTAHAELARKYGVNRRRYFVHPGMNVVYLALNTSRPLFRDVAMRRAVNFAIDRRALLRLEGVNAGSPTDQILPPNMPGFRDASIYPFSPNFERARELAGGRSAKAVLYTGGKPVFQNQAAVIQANLQQIGIDVEIKSFAYPVWVAKSGKRGEPFDLNLTIWAADYPDPYDGRRIRAADNLNWAYFDDPTYNGKLATAAGLYGDARYRAYAALDVDIMRNAAPWVPLYNLNVRDFISSRVGCYRFHAVWGFSLASACLR